MSTEYPKLDLIYFKMRAFTEAVQMQLCYGKIPYNYHFPWDYFDKPWPEVKQEVGFGQLPLLIINDKNKIWQSGSIMRYTANLAKTIPESPENRGVADAIFESSQELFQPLNATINFRVGEEYERFKKIILDDFRPRLVYFNKFLESDKSGPFFFGKTPFYCDFGTYHQFSLIRVLDNKIFDKFSLVDQFMDGIENLSGVSEYLSSRPELKGIGDNPKLVIDGKAVSTGMRSD
jgi:glutathione S-transferase